MESFEEKLKLIKPSTTWEQEIRSFRDEFLISGESMDGCGGLKDEPDIDAWIMRNRLLESKENLPNNFVTADLYLAIVNHSVVGMIQFRHELNDFLRLIGGNIGYAVRPSMRNRGIAKEMLRGCLEKCREKGLDRVLITCVDSNIASKRVIASHGGVYENTVYFESEQKWIERYWITFQPRRR